LVSSPRRDFHSPINETVSKDFEAVYGLILCGQREEKDGHSDSKTAGDDGGSRWRAQLVMMVAVGGKQ
ncbi:hypothetical protein Ancab_035700, partial [Ancistrocladus abbreviatus]